jgi:nitrogen regulatory protein PII
MYALCIIINDVMKIDMIHEILYEHHVGARTLDSRGMGRVLLNHHVEIPIIGSMRKYLDGNKPYNKTIISIIKEKTKLDEVVDDIRERVADFGEKGVGFIFVLPVIECYDLGNKNV